MFDNVTRATELANDIRHMWQQYEQLRKMRDAYHRNRDRHNISAMNQRMNGLVLDMNYRQGQWEAVTGKRWTSACYDLPKSDEVMESAFAALADELEAQDAELLQEAVDVLTVWEWTKKHDGDISSFNGSAISASLWSDGIGAFALFDSVTEAAAWVRQQEGDSA